MIRTSLAMSGPTTSVPFGATLRKDVPSSKVPLISWSWITTSAIRPPSTSVMKSENARSAGRGPPDPWKLFTTSSNMSPAKSQSQICFCDVIVFSPSFGRQRRGLRSSPRTRLEMF